MRRTIHHSFAIIALLIALLLCLMSADVQAQQVYSAPFMADLPGDNPLAWDRRIRVNTLKDLTLDNRMVKYGVAAASQLTNDLVLRTLDQSESADPKRPTSFMAAYNTRGCYIYIKSDDPDIAAAVEIGRRQTLEIFIAPQTPGDTGYFRVEVNIVTGQWYATNYQGSSQRYEPLDRFLKVRTAILPDGQAWGTVLFIPWQYVHDRLPFDGQSWAFTFMRWSPTGGVTWGGKVHEQGAWGRIQWQAPPAEERLKIQRAIITQAWKAYRTQAAALKAHWLDAHSDQAFYEAHLQPLIERLNAFESQVKALDTLDEPQLATLYAQVTPWMQLEHEASRLRRAYLLERLQ